MERIEELVHPNAPHAQYRDVWARGERHGEVWLPSLPLPMYGLAPALKDAWAVLWGRAAAVQWPHHRS